MLNMILVTEQNVDGCGSSASMLLRTKEPVSEELLGRLESEMSAMKSKMEDDTTEDMIREAADMVFGKDRWDFVSMAEASF